jgi:Mn2+/Fe2+ NRAMP family transporter
MVAIMIVVSSAKVMGKYAASPALRVLGWCATALMAVVVAAMLLTSNQA